jgi:putative integral membrane protein (TIGR02587 family)
LGKHFSKRKKSEDWSKEFRELISGASGAFLFGVPLLYTMEVWFIGSFVQPSVMLLILAATFVVVFLLNRAEGFREECGNSTLDALAESVEALAIGVVCATLVLILLERISFETPLGEAIGKIIVESVPCAFGVALSRSILNGERFASDEDKSSRSQGNNLKTKKKKQGLLKDTIADLSATLIGATIVAFNVAPTDEVRMLAASAAPLRLLITIAASLIISYGIVFAAGFTNQKKRRQQRGLFQKPLGETIFSYIVALIAAVLMLWFFHQLTFGDPWQTWLRYTLILGFPAAIGGAAGRLAV